MRSLEDLKLVPVWVNPGHRIASAKLLMAGHKLRAIGVLQNAKLVGVITAERIECADDLATVESIMRPAGLILQASLPVPKAAQIFIEEEVDFAPVLSEDEYVGMLTAHSLLRELRRSWDPLTNLGWSDRLREWGVESLKAGKEVSLLFIDLDNFGDYNKAHGHIVGDRVLRRVASMLKECVDQDSDILVRYGGDEFVIGSTRDQTGARALANRLLDRGDEVLSDEMQMPVRFTIGISGGRRTRERDNIHYAATFDELINSASKDCIARKRSDAAARVQPEQLARPRQDLVD